MNLTFDGIRPKYSKPLLSVADTIAYECKPRSHINNISLVTERNNLKALTLSPILYGQIKASNIKCVPVSTKITNLALGNAALVPGRLPGRPKTLAFSSLSGISKQVPSIATTLNPLRNTPTVSVVPIGRTS